METADCEAESAPYLSSYGMVRVGRVVLSYQGWAKWRVSRLPRGAKHRKDRQVSQASKLNQRLRSSSRVGSSLVAIRSVSFKFLCPLCASAIVYSDGEVSGKKW